MKKVIVITIVLASAAFSGFAQDMKSESSTKGNATKKELSIDQRVKNQSDKAEKDLGLSAEQKTKWANAVRNRITANKPIKEKLQGSTTPDERKKLHAEAKANMKKFDDEVNLFLTPEQKLKYEAKKKEKRDNFEKRKGGTKGGAPAVNEVEELNED